MPYGRFVRAKKKKDIGEKKEKNGKKKASYRRTGFVSPSQAPSLSEIQYIISFCKNRKHTMMVLTGWHLALRVNELVNVRVNDFVLRAEDAYLHVRNEIAKKGSGGAVPILCYEYLERLRKYIDDEGLEPYDYLFCHGKDKARYARNYVINLFAKLGNTAFASRDIKRESFGDDGKKRNLFHPHMLRHSRARWLLENGARVDAVKDFLRHEDSFTTLRYYGSFLKSANFEHLRSLPQPKWYIWGDQDT